MKNFIWATQLLHTTFLPHMMSVPWNGLLFLWENEFSTTFFIFHIIYQKQINININVEVGKENLCEIQVSHLQRISYTFRFGKVNYYRKRMLMLFVGLYMFELTVLFMFYCYFGMLLIIFASTNISWMFVFLSL